MSAIAQALNEQDRHGGAGLLIPTVLSDMPEDVRTLAVQLLASHRSDRAVAEAFCDDGYIVSQNAVRNYRRNNRLHRFAR